MAPVNVFTGVDLVDVEDLRKIIAAGGDSFLEANWTQHERSYANGRIDRLATRWAMKEAVIKALGRGIGSIDPVDVEVVSSEGDQPALKLRRSAKRAEGSLGIYQWSVSMSHQGQYAIALATALGESNA